MEVSLTALSYLSYTDFGWFYFTQFRYKTRVYKQTNLDEKHLAKLHTKVGVITEIILFFSKNRNIKWTFKVCYYFRHYVCMLNTIGSLSSGHALHSMAVSHKLYVSPPIGQSEEVHGLHPGRGCGKGSQTCRQRPWPQLPWPWYRRWGVRHCTLLFLWDLMNFPLVSWKMNYCQRSINWSTNMLYAYGNRAEWIFSERLQDICIFSNNPCSCQQKSSVV